jgi:hypothetical protein
MLSGCCCLAEFIAGVFAIDGMFESLCIELTPALSV